VGCLYCGKEIGPFRVLRDSEFCSSVHRKSYNARLGRALGKLGAPEPPPAGVAGFRIAFPIQPGSAQRTPERGYLGRYLGAPKIGKSWPVTLPPALGGSFRASAGATCAGPADKGHATVTCIDIAARVRMPRFELAAMTGVTTAGGSMGAAAPPIFISWLPLPPAQAAECWLERATAAPVPAVIEILRPGINGLTGAPAIVGDAVAPAGRKKTASKRAAASSQQPKLNQLAGPVTTTRAGAAVAECLVIPAVAGPMSAAASIRQPRIDSVAGNVTAIRGASSLSPESWTAVPQAQPAECLITSALAGSISATSPIRQPKIDGITGAVTTIRGASSFSPESWTALPQAQAAECFVPTLTAGAMHAPLPIRQPGIAHVAAAVITGAHASLAPGAPPTPPAALEYCMPLPAAEPVELLVTSSLADRIPAALAPCLPGIDGIPITGTYVRSVSRLAHPLEAELTALTVSPAFDSGMLAHRHNASHLRFALHAADDFGARVGLQGPMPAGEYPALTPAAVESVPCVGAFTAAALPASIACTLPAAARAAAPVLAHAGSVAAPAAAAVESMPAAGKLVPVAIEMRSALRLPVLTRFHLVQDGSEALAAPVCAAGPVAVESSPALAGLTLVAREVVPPIAVQAFDPELVAQFGYPSVASAVPAAAEPPTAERKAAVLNPIARISTPDAARPERPVPAIPRPGLFPLHYHCQPITSAPAQSLELLPSTFAVAPLPFAVSVARCEELFGKKESRKVLPFEQVLARPVDPSTKRVNLSAIGKIAAAVMVGIALWTGSRIANFSQHDALKAQVATAERGVTVAEARGVDPMDANYGSGPMGKVKRAIAIRAASEITDTFKSGMGAWGAETKAWAPGWKRHPQGYVSTGEMALFRPSLKYTDYRMEFYGQIESKSMGWVVRAKDQKNYYAMKFTVVEAGLRPMIAMVHYGVTNGKQVHKVQTPLNVMVHNNQPYHVAVDVRGNRFSASIEGEPIETWTDETLAQGGVGFFSDAGEKARLYWMKLSRNQDWLGRFCAYLSDNGRSGQQTAELWGPEIPHDTPQPAHPRMPEMALAAGAGLGGATSTSRAKTGKDSRNEPWIS
jgi:hypothetical protein